MGETGVLLAATAITGSADLIGSRVQANAQRAQGRYQEQIYESNARMADIQAQDATIRGNREANIIRGKGRQIQGSQRAALAGQGVDVNVGTPANLQTETGTMSEMDALTVQNNAWREAWGYKSEASNLRSQGKFARLGAENDANNTLLTGGLNFAKDLTRGIYLYGNTKKTKTKKE